MTIRTDFQTLDFTGTVVSFFPDRGFAFIADDASGSHIYAHIEIHDLRVLRNRNDELWTALPTFAIPEGKSYRYQATVVIPRELRNSVSETVLAEYESWAAKQNTPAFDGEGGGR